MIILWAVTGWLDYRVTKGEDQKMLGVSRATALRILQ